MPAVGFWISARTPKRCLRTERTSDRSSSPCLMGLRYAISLPGETRKCRACSQAWRCLSRRAFCSHYVLVGMRASYFPNLVAVTVPGQGCSFLGITGLHGDTPAFEAIKQPQLESSKPPLCQYSLVLTGPKAKSPSCRLVGFVEPTARCVACSLHLASQIHGFPLPRLRLREHSHGHLK